MRALTNHHWEEHLRDDICGVVVSIANSRQCDASPVDALMQEHRRGLCVTKVHLNANNACKAKYKGHREALCVQAWQRHTQVRRQTFNTHVSNST